MKRDRREDNRRVYWRKKLREDFGIDAGFEYSSDELKAMYREAKALDVVEEQLENPELIEESEVYSPEVDEFYATQRILERQRKAEIVKQNLLNGGESALLHDRGGGRVGVQMGFWDYLNYLRALKDKEEETEKSGHWRF